MTLNIILSFFSGISFVFYGIASFRSKRMIAEYDRWGYLKYRHSIGSLQFLGGLGLILGLFLPSIILVSSFGLTTMMMVAVLVRIKIKDDLFKMFPAIFYALVNAFLFYNNYLFSYRN
jgi:hypothetical protein